MDVQKLHNLAISDSGYIFDPASGNSFTANETAVFIIGGLKKGGTSDSIAADLVEQFDVESGTAEQDTVTIIELLQNNNLI